MAYVENAPHNPEVVGSNPAPATKKLQLVGYAGELILLLSDYVSTIFRLLSDFILDMTVTGTAAIGVGMKRRNRR